jgi:hypothetical protein
MTSNLHAPYPTENYSSTPTKYVSVGLLIAGFRVQNIGLKFDVGIGGTDAIDDRMARVCVAVDPSLTVYQC